MTGPPNENRNDADEGEDQEEPPAGFIDVMQARDPDCEARNQGYQRPGTTQRATLLEDRTKDSGVGDAQSKADQKRGEGPPPEGADPGSAAEIEVVFGKQFNRLSEGNMTCAHNVE